jgi:chaperone BCS1
MTFERQRNLQEQVDAKGRVSYISTLSGNEPIVISCPSFIAGTKPIQQFLQHVKTMPAKDNTTTIYRPDGANSTWDAGITRPSRNLNAVTLDAHVKDDLVKDIETYLAPETRKYYANRGIPWRRGFLFYGNPGTGKTSFSNALAGHLGLNIYMVSLSNATLTDTMLETLFEQLPSKCIVLLEDIDSAGIQRENMQKELAKATRKSSKYHPQYYDENGNPITPEMFVRRMGGVTLSGLLNVLDGIHSKEGHVTIMTSNSPDSLDPALVRPGRIDRKVLFGYASSEVIRKLFVHIFSKAPEEQLEADKAEESQHDISSLADKFADIVPSNKLTPAEVQGYLLVHREDPVEAVTEAEPWVQKTIETKEKGANVEAFAGQESSQTKDGKRDAQSKKKPKKARTAESTKAASSNDGGEEVDSSEDDDEEETSSGQTTSSPDDDNSSQSTTATSPCSSVANTPAHDPPVYTPPMPTPYPTQNPSTYSTQLPSTLLSQSSAPTPLHNANAAALQALSQQFLQAGGFGIVVPSLTPPVPVGPTVGQPANDVASGAGGVKKKTKAKSKRK